MGLVLLGFLAAIAAARQESRAARKSGSAAGAARRDGGRRAGTPGIAAPASNLERQIESKLAERDAMQQRMEAQALNALNLAPVITKTAEVLAKHLREKIKLEPETPAQVLRTWIREEDS